MSGKTNTLKAKISRNEQLIIIFEVVLYKVDCYQTKPQWSGRGPRSGLQWNIPNSNGKEKQEGEKIKDQWWEITTEWLRLSVKADALVTEPMRMQETGCGWCLLPGQQSPSPYLLAKTLVATAHSSPMAEITVTCGEHTTCSSQSSETLHTQLTLLTFSLQGNFLL